MGRTGEAPLARAWLGCSWPDEEALDTYGPGKVAPSARGFFRGWPRCGSLGMRGLRYCAQAVRPAQGMTATRHGAFSVDNPRCDQ
jgi:hypothetical protein